MLNEQKKVLREKVQGLEAKVLQLERAFFEKDVPLFSNFSNNQKIGFFLKKIL